MLPRPQFKFHGMVTVEKGAKSQANSHPHLQHATFAHALHRGPHSNPLQLTHAQIFGALPGRGPKAYGDWSHAALRETPFHPQLYSEPSKANHKVSPFLGCQLQQFLPGDSSSRGAKAGFREIHLLPGYEQGFM